MAEEETLESLLYEARVKTLAFARRRRSTKRDLEKEKAWVKYFRKKWEETKRPKFEAKLREHEQKATMLETRLEIYSAAARWRWTRDSAEFLRMRRAQRRYYEAKARVLERERPEEAKKIREELVAPEELYKEWEEVMTKLQEAEEALEAAHDRYKRIRWTPAWWFLSPTSRYIMTRSLRELFARRYEVGKEAETLSAIEKTLPEVVEGFPEIVEEYRRLKREYEERGL